MEVITMKQRFEYLNNIHNEIYGKEIPFPKFMECVFTQLEIEIRGKNSKIGNLFETGVGTQMPVKSEEYKYDYNK